MGGSWSLEGSGAELAGDGDPRVLVPELRPWGRGFVSERLLSIRRFLLGVTFMSHGPEDGRRYPQLKAEETEAQREGSLYPSLSLVYSDRWLTPASQTTLGKQKSDEARKQAGHRTVTPIL